MEVEYFHIENKWEDVLNNPKQGKVLRELRGNIIIVEVDYDNKVERNNMSDRI